jgi:hypothetical protein
MTGPHFRGRLAMHKILLFLIFGSSANQVGVFKG